MLKIRIRTKLAAALAVPLVALVAISGFEAVQASEEADDVRSETELAVVAVGPSSLTTELQNERNYTALDLIGLAEAATLEVSSVAEARDRVDDTVEELRRYLAGREGITADSFGPAFEALEADLEDTRALWDDDDGDKDLENQELADEVFDRFTVMTEAFFDATESVATAVDDNALRNGIEIVDNSNRRGELLANITRLLVLDTLTDGGEEIFRSDAAARLARLDATEDRIEQLAVGPYADVPDETLGRDFDVDAREHFVSYLAGETVDISGLLAAVSAGGAAENTSSAEMASEILEAEAARLTSAADERREQFILLAAGIIIFAVVSSWLASRSITRPLRKLRVEAAEMAGTRLPAALHQISLTPLGEDVVVPHLDPIVVKTRDEVHEVVDVLNDVQDRTLALAVDQAVLRRNIADSFVNLGRRNQNLLDRQLEFISELEQNETEPEELESLFRLDHLATRMRRNAESLLVLAGVESPRQWTAPVEVDDVVRAALGEVEDYQRVNVRHLDPVMVAGTAAAGVSHVLAELIENALNYSPPGAEVEVKGRENSDGYMIAVDDDGIGMSAEDLDRANRRLSGQESYTVAPSRYLGHYVAGNLATRFGISVRLQDSP
ncbi:MAG: sensor histidine kinase, partial [Acidimicrobiales bacterium]